MSSVLSYQPRPTPQPPSEFDYHFDSELARRLRTRFLWYCALTVVLSLALLLPGMLGVTGGPVGGSVNGQPLTTPAAARALNYGTTLLSVLVYVAAFVYVFGRRLRRESLLRLALWVYVLASIPGLIGMRLIFQMVLPPDMVEQVMADVQRQRGSATQPAGAATAPATAPATLPTPRAEETAFMTGFRAGYQGAAAAGGDGAATTRPIAPPQQQQLRALLAVVLHPGFIFAFVVPLVMLFHHSFACLFIPWTLRQSLTPAFTLLGLLAVIVLVDVLGGDIPWFVPLGLLPVTALAFVPGSTFCWWRFSRLRREIKLNYESDRFRSMQAELAGARRILETALPSPRAGGPVRLAYTYEPMRQIGGDLLFVHPPGARNGTPDETPMSVVLLDVTGHGIAAALTVNRLVGELERLFAEDPHASPGAVLQALNSYVFFTMSRHDMYVTAIALRFDPAAGTVAYASAGHPSAYLRRAADGALVSLESTTMLLGVVDGQHFAPDPATLPLAPGDAVVAYTDGASEAMPDNRGDMLGMVGVRNLVADVAGRLPDPAAWPEEVMRRVVAYRNAPPADDTLVVTIYRPC